MIEIEVQAARRTSRGEVWRAALPDGAAIESRTPLFAAARALLAAGADPAVLLAMRHRGSATVAMRSTIGEAAKWTVQEEPRLALVEHQPWEGPAPVVGEAKTGPSRPRPVLDTGEGGKLPFLEGAAAQPGPRQRRALADSPAPTTGPPRHQLKERVKQARMS